ncbi:MATE family efflux transporter [Halovulum dunhuangense]|uniref:Multidrug-efflux transporter n=1 Tax=Halovulum dunhuangense TaxID=1505036 RepID=A0A849KR87_9RHOB|nr:MATE family efflux transporter [Halovulum dunhuangense]NNU79379.1 MATE family efflux transporter [Halovulum dunhuangense]
MAQAFVSDPGISPPGRQGWPEHMRATIRLGLPLIGTQLAQQGLTITDTIMLGWLGAEPLAAGVLATTLFFIGFILCTGFAHAVMPLAANAEGDNDTRGVRRSVRMGLWVVMLVVTLTMPVLWHTEALLLALGQEPALAALAQDYMRIGQWALYPSLGVMVLRSYLSALERTGIVLWATLGGVVLNAVLNWTLIFGNLGAPALGIRGAAIATLGTYCLILAIMLVYCTRVRALRKYELFVRFFRPDWAAFREVMRLGAPISASLIAEVGLFGASSIMMGWIGTVPLAAHGIAIQVISALFMVPLGLMMAGTVRVGRAHGARDAVALDLAAKAVLLLAVGFAILSALVLWLLPETLIGLFIDRENPAAAEILQVGVVLLAVAAVFQIVDTLQVVSAGLLRGLKDTRRPMVIAVFSYWGVGLPVAYVLGFPLGLGGVGIWAGLAAGLACAAVLLTRRFMRRNALGLV